MARSRLIYYGLGTLSVSTVGAYQAFNYQFGDDALPRLATAYRTAIPAFVAYRSVQLRYETGPKQLAKLLRWFGDDVPEKFGIKPDPVEASRQYELLHKVWAHRMYDTFLKLRGFYIKTGQLIANNIGDAAPPYWQKVLEPFLDKIPPKDFTYVRATIEQELGAKLEDIFESFETEPLASASIGQVHKAILRKSGHKVVVKVMYPEVEAQFRGDVTSAKFFVRFALPEHLPPLNEIEKQFANEFDYRREAKQLDMVRKNLLIHAQKDFGHLIIPAPILEYCTKRVLVMDEVPNAEKLTTALDRDMRSFAKDKKVSIDQLLDEEKRLNKEFLEKGQLRCGPSASDMDKFIAYRSWYNRLTYPLQLVGLAQPLHIPLNHAKLIDELFRIHGHEILIDGAFNGDPHPGNLLLSYPDHQRSASHVRLALVDYGQVKTLTQEQRLKFARLIVALSKCDHPEIVYQRKNGSSTISPNASAAQTEEERRHEEAKKLVVQRMREMDFRTTKNDPEIVFRLAQLYFDRDDRIVTEGMHVQEYVEYLSSNDAVDKINDDYVLIGRCALMLRGLGHALNQHRSTTHAWVPFARQILLEAGENPDATN